ncbi:hypothetical protein E2C01_001676 [Portunus trituberculatus]|uniref:Uncharacterized protein n=1 Tax=Portunus trituberculatus TaxID=210409 RepID=A0A5B7CN36_PORTR|nr:hypothetical protein [Portunus trituberculatus]
MRAGAFVECRLPACALVAVIGGPPAEEMAEEEFVLVLDLLLFGQHGQTDHMTLIVYLVVDLLGAREVERGKQKSRRRCC